MGAEVVAATPIHVALAAVMADVGAVSKDGRNASQGFNFRGIDAVVNAVGPVLRKHGVIPMPIVESSAYDIIPTKNGGTMRQCTLTVRWRFVGPAGDHLDAVVIAEAMDSGDKATSKAHSVAYRTALLQVLCIPTDEPDPDETSHERAAAPPPVQRSAMPRPNESPPCSTVTRLRRVGRGWTASGAVPPTCPPTGSRTPTTGSRTLPAKTARRATRRCATPTRISRECGRG